MRGRLISLTLLAVMAIPFAGTGSAVESECPKEAAPSSAMAWPRPLGKNDKGFDVLHFGEGHWNEGQGPKTMPILVQDLVAFDPDFVLFSSDMADIGSLDRLGCFRNIMQPLLDADVPWFNSPGNHDRIAAAGPGGVAAGAIDVYREVFASMPAPWGDAPAFTDRFHPPTDEPDDGEGASTHYYFDYGSKKKPAVRVVVLDNSQQSLTNSDVDQYPTVGAAETDASQLDFLRRVAAEGTERGSLVFVVMHQPTQDPRDLSNVYPASLNHTMGKGASPDNVAFDLAASETGVDATLLGHIQGNVEYSFEDVNYYIDGGGGGSPYALRETGTDTGYYYGFRVLRVYPSKSGWTYRTYFVPLVDKIKIEGIEEAAVGDAIDLTATATQPFDPKYPPRIEGQPNEPIELELRLPDDSRVDRATLPELAYMWKTSDPSVLRPAGSDQDPVNDPAFDPKTMTMTGSFEAVGTGTATITIMVGTHVQTFVVEVS